MWSETIEFRGYREPFLPGFFEALARQVPLTGRENLLDLACGTGAVAFGFSPFVNSLTGVDMEQPMLQEARRQAEARGIAIRLVQARAEDYLQSSGPFDIATIGKAHWYLDAGKVVPRLEALLPARGRVVVCMATSSADWRQAFLDAMVRWSPEFPWNLLKVSPVDFFAGSQFRQSGQVVLEKQQTLPVEDVVRRAFGYPCTARGALGEREAEFVADLKRSLWPYVREGMLVEQLRSVGFVFGKKAS